MYNRFSVDLASELRPSDCIDLYVFIAIPPLKSTKHYLPIYKCYLHLKVILQAILRLLLSVPFSPLPLSLLSAEHLTHRARAAVHLVRVALYVFFFFFLFLILFLWAAGFGRRQFLGSAELQASLMYLNHLTAIRFMIIVKTVKLKVSGWPH